MVEFQSSVRLAASAEYVLPGAFGSCCGFPFIRESSRVRIVCVARLKSAKFGSPA